MTKQELYKILEQHKLWLDSNCTKGVRTDLSEADLYGADLSRANLSRANLSRANLYGADLSEADLSEADLSGVDLSNVYSLRYTIYDPDWIYTNNLYELKQILGLVKYE